MGRKGSSNRESNNYIDSDRVSVERVPHKAYNELYNLKVIKIWYTANYFYRMQMILI